MKLPDIISNYDFISLYLVYFYYFFFFSVIEKRCILILCWFHEWCTIDKMVHSNADQILCIHVQGTYICNFFLDIPYVTLFGQYTYANIFNDDDINSISLF